VIVPLRVISLLVQIIVVCFFLRYSRFETPPALITSIHFPPCSLDPHPDRFQWTADCSAAAPRRLKGFSSPAFQPSSRTHRRAGPRVELQVSHPSPSDDPNPPNTFENGAFFSTQIPRYSFARVLSICRFCSPYLEPIQFSSEQPSRPKPKDPQQPSASQYGSILFAPARPPNALQLFPASFRSPVGIASSCLR